MQGVEVANRVRSRIRVQHRFETCNGLHHDWDTSNQHLISSRDRVEPR